MADDEEIIAVGWNKKNIKMGDTVKYVNGDTVSRVGGIKKDEKGKVWVLLEDRNLWYRDEILELTDIKVKAKKEEKQFTAEDLEERLKKQKEAIQSFDLGKAGGGGAGG